MNAWHSTAYAVGLDKHIRSKWGKVFLLVCVVVGLVRNSQPNPTVMITITVLPLQFRLLSKHHNVRNIEILIME
jgi:hypothetical protein